jgi:hypothetical protein
MLVEEKRHEKKILDKANSFILRNHSFHSSYFSRKEPVALKKSWIHPQAMRKVQLAKELRSEEES